MFAVADILGHVEHDGARAAGRGDREGAADEFGDALRALDAQEFLAGRAQDVDLPGLLRHVLPGVVAIGIARDRHQRDAGIERFHQPRDEVRRPRAERRIHHAGAVRHPRPGIGGEGAAAFVVDQVVLEAEGAHRLVEGQQLEAAHAEHRAHLVRLEHARQRLPARDGELRIGGRGVGHARWSFSIASASRAMASRTLPPGLRPSDAARLFTQETMPVSTAERPSPIRAVQAE